MYDKEEVKRMVRECLSRSHKLGDITLCNIQRISNDMSVGIPVSDDAVEYLKKVWLRVIKNG